MRWRVHVMTLLLALTNCLGQNTLKEPRDRYSKYNNLNNRDPYDQGQNDLTKGQSDYNRDQSDPFRDQTDYNRNQLDFNRKQNKDPFNRGQNDFNNRDTSRENVFGFQYRSTTLQSDSLILKEASYFIVASRMVRPGQVYRVAVNIPKSSLPMLVRASIQRNGVEVASDFQEIQQGIPDKLMMRIPPTSVSGDYQLRIKGNYNTFTGGQAFFNETQLVFTQRSMTIFIQSEKPVYIQGQTIRFRTIPINTELKGFDDTVEVRILDPNRRIMRRWLSRQSNLGTVSLSYQLSDQPVFGEWIIEVIAQGQVEEKTIVVEEYYQTRFEVSVTMSAFFFDSDNYVHGIVMANYTSGAPVRGNLTLKATVRPLYEGRRTPAVNDVRTIPDKYFNFNEYYPAWYNPPNSHERNLPVLRFFNGTCSFHYPMSELLEYVSNDNDGLEVNITATVGEHFLDEIIIGWSCARIYNSTVRVSFFGGSPQVFKPGMPFDLNLVASFHDGFPLRPEQLYGAQLEVRVDIVMKSGSRRSNEHEVVKVSPGNDAVWTMRVDLRNQLFSSENQKHAQMQLNDIATMRFHAYFTDGEGHQAYAELLMLAHESPLQRHIKVWTSTEKARVGEYLVLHVQTNFYIESFNYLIMSKGAILLTGDEKMRQAIKTFAVPLSPEMAPTATVVVWHVSVHGVVVADSLTLPVNGISRNNFTIFINNKKARTGERVEVAIYGEPGSYVALSGIDRSFYAMQAGNELTYANVLEKMSSYGEQTNGTHSHSWLFHTGNPDEVAYFPSSTYGIDVNRTFEYVGLVVFTDAFIHRRDKNCNLTMGYLECLSGQCYRAEQQCDGIQQCDDGTDEARCSRVNATDIANFRKWRFNRIQRQYENVWMWRDVNIGPHGRSIFNTDVPKTPVHWMITAFGMSPSNGFGMLPAVHEYLAVLPFYINVEMPDRCRQGEQIGIRVTVFNYMHCNIEATVILGDSRDYKFIHVEDNGIVQSYNPRTSFGEHQFFVWIPAQDTAIVYLPIVPIRLGDMKVRIRATTLIGSDHATKMVRVEADGLPQYRHQSILLDLTNRAYVFQYMHVNITETPLIPYEEDRYYIFGSNKATISVVGDVVGPIFPTMPVNATSLIGLPMDCGEQTIFSFATNMYMTLHMRLMNQRNATQEKDSFYYMNIGYQRALSFMNPDGSFSLFRSDWNMSSSSVWLTAYCVRIFEEASFYEWENYLYVDPKVISQAVSWLLDRQIFDGSFYEVTWLPDRKMNSTLSYDEENYFYRNRNIALTAHVVITLVSLKDLSDGLGARVALATQIAVGWLEQNLQLLKSKGRPYEIAIVAYALMQAQSSAADTAFNILRAHRREEGSLAYWGRERVPIPPTKLENQKPFSLPRLPYKYDSENIETTAYALLVYVAHQDVDIDPIAKWLNTQRLTDGGWASTQDTAWAMKALIDYTVRSRIRDVSQLAVTVEATALGGKSQTLYVNNKNLARLQTFQIPEAWGMVKVQAKGSGFAILQMHVQYNVDIKRFQTKPPVLAFDLKTYVNFHGRNQSHITYLSCQSWINVNESLRSGMAVLDVTIPTGYIIQQQILDHYVRARRVRNLQRARFQPSKVLFYFDYLDQEETCVNFTIERWYPVANMSRYLPIRVYDYYAPERFNETMFDSLSTYVLNICEVCGSSQCPYCPIYNAAVLLSSPGVFFITLYAVISLFRNFRIQVVG